MEQVRQYPKITDRQFEHLIQLVNEATTALLELARYTDAHPGRAEELRFDQQAELYEADDRLEAAINENGYYPPDYFVKESQ
jgi:hypothetical protein